MRSYNKTYGMPTLISHCSNNYGFNQYPEKLIPLTISKALASESIPIYGDGQNVRDWVFVADHCEAILAILARGRVGEQYNVGAKCERTNLEVVSEVCTALEELMPAEHNNAFSPPGASPISDLITLVPDRPGHDRRYAIDCSRIERELGLDQPHQLRNGPERNGAMVPAQSQLVPIRQARTLRRQTAGPHGGHAARKGTRSYGNCLAPRSHSYDHELRNRT